MLPPLPSTYCRSQSFLPARTISSLMRAAAGEWYITSATESPDEAVLSETQRRIASLTISSTKSLLAGAMIDQRETISHFIARFRMNAIRIVESLRCAYLLALAEGRG